MSNYLVKAHQGYSIVKLDDNMDVIATYVLTPTKAGYDCTCPSRRTPCKHVAMVKKFLTHGAVGGLMLWDDRTELFVRNPLAQINVL